MRHKISAVEKKSIASEMEVLPGDFLCAIDGKEVIDVVDYRFRLHSEYLNIEIEKPDGEIWELDIEKEGDDDLGLTFESPLMSDIKLCKNKCIFCFVDQEPPGLRKSLYIKDDDWRLSFLHGNFVTLTNISDEEAKRIASLHLSPLNISVHAADMDLRNSMMRPACKTDLFDYLQMFSNAGIAMNFQIVLCKGINDGCILESTVDKLANLKGAASVAVVPVGLTKYREGLTLLDSFSSDESAKVVKQVEAMQSRYIKKSKSSFVFLSDEWYIMAGLPLPSYNKYGDFPQLSNGVGMTRLFERDFLNELARLPVSLASKSFTIVTGTLSASFMRSLASKFCDKFKNVRLSVAPVDNHFYGQTVTVSGLITGVDILKQLRVADKSPLFLPGNAFRSSSEEMIDGITRHDLERLLSRRVLIGSQNGGEFARQVYKEFIC